ncbi:serine hydrolase domain-containing protein [Ovoidimarina sediminis]|uniref:serine hydrolase domain-containing protein n=1 Tax=Ovoidimarina sediminis TaxID=3079856 RepID=UPI00292FD05B|nr:serine hydrolase domain-containing protein [Rhodophyticola sp. MJ-SS7]
MTDPDRGGRYLLAAVAEDGTDGRNVFLTGRVRPGEAARDRPELETYSVRVASISKALTARAALELVQAGLVSLDDLVGDRLAPYGYPEWLSGRGIRLRDLLCHCSGQQDRAGYVTEPPDDLPSFLARNAAGIVADWPAGAHFFYANLNYVLLGAVIEAVSGERFDRVVDASVLRPMNIAGWYNWAGADAGTRRRRIPLFERRGKRYDPEADGEPGDWTADVIWRNGRGIGLGTYRLARDSFLFSPHAGLRTTIGGLARLARSIGGDDKAAVAMREQTWRYDGTNGTWSDGLFPAFGLGLTLYEDHSRIPGRLAGHAGHALGFTGGAWCDLETGRGWAYWLTGSEDATVGQEEESFFAHEEQVIFQTI